MIATPRTSKGVLTATGLLMGLAWAPCESAASRVSSGGATTISSPAPGTRDPHPPAGGAGRETRLDPDAVYRDYFTNLQLWLQHHKTYPKSAYARRQQGTAVLVFTVDRRGRVLGSRLLSGTGHPALDREVLDMLKRASPLPPFPDGIPREKLTLSVPVGFSLD